MARFGVEGIRYFNHARAAGVSTASDLTYTFNRTNGFDSKLRGAGHHRAFYWANTDCWETDIRDTDRGGSDRSWVDDVDLFWIETHGNHESDGQARMLYDTPQAGWRTYSGKWQLGENWTSSASTSSAGGTVDPSVSRKCARSLRLLPTSPASTTMLSVRQIAD